MTDDRRGGIVLVLASGHLRLDVHGFGLVVVAQAVWFITTGIEVAQARPAS